MTRGIGDAATGDLHTPWRRPMLLHGPARRRPESMGRDGGLFAQRAVAATGSPGLLAGGVSPLGNASAHRARSRQAQPSVRLLQFSPPYVSPDLSGSPRARTPGTGSRSAGRSGHRHG